MARLIELSYELLPDLVDFQTFVNKASETGVKYVCADKNTNFTTKTRERMTVANAVQRGHYIQHGLGYELNEPAVAPDELVYGTHWDAPILNFLKRLSCTQHLIQDTNPVWIRGDGKIAKSYTHFDDYLNFAMVLAGKKTFYVLSPENARTQLLEKRGYLPKDAAGAVNEMSNVYPDSRYVRLKDDSSVEIVDLKPPKELYTNERGQVIASAVSLVFKKIVLLPGQLMILPPRWWHFVVSEPNTIMVNWWFGLKCDKWSFDTLNGVLSRPDVAEEPSKKKQKTGLTISSLHCLKL